MIGGEKPESMMFGTQIEFAQLTVRIIQKTWNPAMSFLQSLYRVVQHFRNLRSARVRLKMKPPLLS